MKNTESNNPCPSCGQPIPEDAPQDLCPQCVLSGVATQPDLGPVEVSASDFPDKETVAKAFPQLEILELIGHGGMGIVYKARQPNLERHIALKLLPEKLGESPQFAERFSREARTLAHLNHPNIVSVYDFGQTAGLYFLMMEYVDGVNLREAMRAGRFSPNEALEIVPKICEALHYAHEQKILHRDIKPENILLDSKGSVKIADFGIAKLLGGASKENLTLTSTGHALGTPHYMAPEQIENPTQVDHRADIYSLGVVLYELLTGELPIGRFEVPSHKSDVGAGIDEVVLRALEKDRERRQATAEKLKAEVQTADRTPSQPSHTQTEPKRQEASETKPKWSIKSLISSALAAVGLVILSLPILVSVMREDNISPVPIFMVWLPGLALGIIASILGWVALSEIRHAKGTLFGLPLGVFGALGLPIPALFGVILGIPWLIAVRSTPPTQLSPFSWIVLGSLALVLSLLTIVFTFRWAAGNRFWIPLTRWQKITLGTVAALAILFVVPISRGASTSGRPSPPAEISRVPNAGNITTNGVEIHVQKVELIESEPNPRITLSFTKKENGGDMQWSTRGQFLGNPTSLKGSAKIQIKRDDSVTPTMHTLSFAFPPELSVEEKRDLLIETRGNWQGRKLNIYPGDYRKVLTIHQNSGDDVDLAVMGLLPDSRD